MPEAPSISPASVALAIAATLLLLVSTLLVGHFGAYPALFTAGAPKLPLASIALAALFVMFVMVVISVMLLDKGRLRDEPVPRVSMVLSGSFLLLLLLNANVQALRYDGYTACHAQELHVKFNDLICDLRGTEACSNGGNFDQMRRILASAAANTMPTLDTSTRAREYCMIKLLRDRGFLLQYQQEFLDSLTITDAVDKWCGSKVLGLPTDTTSPFTPFSTNPTSYHSLRTAPLEELRLMTMAVGSALVCMALLYFHESSGKGKVKKAYGLNRVKKD
ncbi:hypothetical protein PHYSODRAFT_303050 [Phytophthora sojae]|uniref:Transmembrane protein n=1 Tax=Phytophthora sojae (strain P6497) TaxID=1094619 RepID=G4ZUN3_PHYSP|nr:hypothetical protein PHYSODRAFT_303050 [Phytophthora sojae]EGZ13507.1 hypothetical protein PHYSODRAFT_303050 [Phytophthora sojae]|eukprot:XP_009530936.1 hypothetical protein PHYSODRAFT_303050 [Phytophthora sojae]